MPLKLQVAVTAFAVHALIPAAALWVWQANENEAGLGAVLVVMIADFPLIPLYVYVGNGHGDIGVMRCLLVSLTFGGLLYAAIATGFAVLLRRAMRR